MIVVVEDVDCETIFGKFDASVVMGPIESSPNAVGFLASPCTESITTFEESKALRYSKKPSAANFF